MKEEKKERRRREGIKRVRIISKRCIEGRGERKREDDVRKMNNRKQEERKERRKREGIKKVRILSEKRRVEGRGETN